MKVQINRPDFYKGDKVVTLSASVTSGEVTKSKKFNFLVRKAPRTEAQAMAEDVAYIKANIPLLIKDNIVVMRSAVMPFGSTVAWSVSPGTNLTNTGIVTRPDFGSPDEAVTITAAVKNGASNESVVISATVLSLTQQDELDVVAKGITWDSIKGTNIDKYRVVDNLVLPTTLSEVAIAWVSSDTRFIGVTGTVTRPEYTESDAQVTLTATLTKGDKTKQVIINGIKVLKKSPSSTQRCEQYVRDEQEFVHWVTANETNANTSLTDITESFVLPAENDDMLLTWSVVSSTGEPTVNNYFRVDYVDDDLDPELVRAEQARRYTATVTRNSLNNTTAYLKVVANISETGEGVTLVPGGTASNIWQLVILKSGAAVLMEVPLDPKQEIEKIEYEKMLASTNIGRATWSIVKHREAMRELHEEIEAKKATILID